MIAIDRIDHIVLTVFDLERTLDEANVLGHRYLFVASLPGDAHRSLDSYASWGDRMNEAGAVARKRDIWIGFHNHGDDHVMLDGAVVQSRDFEVK